MSSISRFINYLYCWIYSSYILHKKLNKILQEPNWLFASFLNWKSFYSTCPHSFLFVVPLRVIRCHLLSFFAARCHSQLLVITGCYSLPIVVSFVVIRFTTRCHSLPLTISLAVTRCHSLSVDVALSVFL